MHVLKHQSLRWMISEILPLVVCLVCVKIVGKMFCYSIEGAVEESQNVLIEGQQILDTILMERAS